MAARYSRLDLTQKQRYLVKVRSIVSIIFCVLLTFWVSAACDNKTAAKSADWYDAESLGQGLRPDVANTAMKQLALSSYADLPLYELRIDFSKSPSSFSLHEKIWYTHRETKPARTLVFLVHANARSETRPMRFIQGKCVDAACGVGWDAKSKITIKPPKPLKRGERLVISLGFEGTLQEIADGRLNMMGQALESMKSIAQSESGGDYGMVAHGGGISSLGDFYAVLEEEQPAASATDSALGDLGATSGISHVKALVLTQPGFEVVSSGASIRKQTLLGDDARPTFTETEISAPLVRNFGFAISDSFQVKAAKVQGIDVRVWHVGGGDLVGQKVRDAAVGSLQVFQDRFGFYPYTELDVVEAPLVGGAGGIEFSGFVTVASMFFRKPSAEKGLLGAMLSSAPQFSGATDAMVEFVTAHEVAHQWWHGLVGSDARKQPYVDEALAQLSALIYFAEKYGDERAELEAKRQVVSNYHMMRLKGLPDRPIDHPVSTFKDQIAYAGIVYGKAPMFYDALRRAIGKKKFDAALKDYVRRYQFKSADGGGLLNLVRRSGDAAKISAISKRWLKQTHGDEDLGKPTASTLMEPWMGDKAIQGMMEALQGQIQGPLDADAPDVNNALREILKSLGDVQTEMKNGPKQP